MNGHIPTRLRFAYPYEELELFRTLASTFRFPPLLLGGGGETTLQYRLSRLRRNPSRTKSP